jgi:hypothetical protein
MNSQHSLEYITDLGQANEVGLLAAGLVALAFPRLKTDSVNAVQAKIICFLRISLVSLFH